MRVAWCLVVSVVARLRGVVRSEGDGSPNGTLRAANVTEGHGRSRVFDERDPAATQADMCAVAVQYSAAPSLCPVGAARFGLPALQAAVPGFAAAWAAMKRSLPGAPCCMGVNHLFAVYHAVRAVQPLAVIESGVAAGHTTFLLRHLLPSAPIFALDPVDPTASYKLGYTGIQGYRDPNPLTTSLVGAAFQDLSQARWDVLIPDPAVRARTFVLLDDHQSTTERVRMLRRWGFRYIFYEDNYPFLVSTSADQFTCPLITLPRTYTSVMVGDAYSPNSMCAPVPAGTTAVLYKDRFGKLCELITVQQHLANLAFLTSTMASYYEYPALYSPCKGGQRAAVLGTPEQLAHFGLPAAEDELWYYGHLHPPLIELKPLAPAAVATELAAATAAADLFAQRVAQGLQVI